MSTLPKEILNKEFISQFKTEEEVSQFITDLHSQLLECLLQAEMDEHLGYEKNQVDGNSSGNSRNGAYKKNDKESLWRINNKCTQRPEWRI